MRDEICGAIIIAGALCVCGGVTLLVGWAWGLIVLGVLTMALGAMLSGDVEPANTSTQSEAEDEARLRVLGK